MSLPNFNRTFAEEKIVQKIVARAAKSDERFHNSDSKVSLAMDIIACHSNGNPLRLEELLKAEDHDFSHDVYGIVNNIDRETGKLKNHFSPRYSSRVKAE